MDAISASGAGSIGTTDACAVSWFFPEVDPACGPGTYKLVSISLALSALSSVTATISVELYVFHPDDSTLGTQVG